MTWLASEVAYRNAVCMNEACDVIDVEINHPMFGWTPTSVGAHVGGQGYLLYDRIKTHAGDDEAPEPWEEPEPAPAPVPIAISRRQFYSALALGDPALLTMDQALAGMQGVLPPPLQAIVDSLPGEADRFLAAGLLIAAQEFERNHPMVAVFKAAQSGWTETDVDNFFRAAAAL